VSPKEDRSLQILDLEKIHGSLSSSSKASVAKLFRTWRLKLLPIVAKELSLN
jgi:hypothetical protein